MCVICLKGYWHGVRPFTSRWHVFRCPLCCLHIQCIKISFCALDSVPLNKNGGRLGLDAEQSWRHLLAWYSCCDVIGKRGSPAEFPLGLFYSTVNLHGDTNKLSSAVGGAAKADATKDGSPVCCCMVQQHHDRRSRPPSVSSRTCDLKSMGGFCAEGSSQVGWTQPAQSAVLRSLQVVIMGSLDTEYLQGPDSI